MSHLKKYLITLEVGGILTACNTRSYVEGIDKLQPSRFLSDFIARKLAIYIQSDLGKLKHAWKYPGGNKTPKWRNWFLVNLADFLPLTMYLMCML